MSTQFIPSEGIDQLHLNNAVQSLIEVIAEHLAKEAAQASINWADDENRESNVFMVDAAKRQILSAAIGFFTIAQPDHNQLTGTHVDAYFQIHHTEPPAKDPEPLEE